MIDAEAQAAILAEKELETKVDVTHISLSISRLMHSTFVMKS
jgi:hypothetical protein